MTVIYTWWGLIVSVIIILAILYYIVEDVEEEIERCEKDPECELTETWNILI